MILEDWKNIFLNFLNSKKNPNPKASLRVEVLRLALFYFLNFYVIISSEGKMKTKFLF